MDNAIKRFFSDSSYRNIYTYKEFIQLSKELIITSDPNELDDKEKKYFNYRKINLQRTNRINKTFKPKREISELINRINQEQHWLVITEDWCGDSAQNLPYIVNYIAQNPHIRLSIILRDENLEVVDSYFKEGNPRSIPKIVGFDKKGNELFIWGPRPKAAQDLVKQLKTEGYSKEDYNKELHLWYSRNKGQELEKEFYSILKNILKLQNGTLMTQI